MEYRMAATTRQPRDTQLAIGDRAAPVWTDLGYAGDANGIAFYFAAHPDTRASVQLCYDRQTGGTTSKPPCPALEPLARFATLVRDSHAALRQSAFTDAQLAALLEVGVLLARARPDDPRGGQAPGAPGAARRAAAHGRGRRDARGQRRIVRRLTRGDAKRPPALIRAPGGRHQTDRGSFRILRGIASILRHATAERNSEGQRARPEGKRILPGARRRPRP
jgi:hypothetical protein